MTIKCITDTFSEIKCEQTYLAKFFSPATSLFMTHENLLKITTVIVRKMYLNL